MRDLRETIAEIKKLSNLDNCWSAEDMQENLEKIHDILNKEYPNIQEQE